MDGNLSLQVLKTQQNLQQQQLEVVGVLLLNIMQRDI